MRWQAPASLLALSAVISASAPRGAAGPDTRPDTRPAFVQDDLAINNTLYNSVGPTVIAPGAVWHRYDGVGGLSGGGGTANFLMAYNRSETAAMLDLLFVPGHAASLDILKVEIGADDQTTNGCEASHMRAPDEVCIEQPREKQYFV